MSSLKAMLQLSSSVNKLGKLLTEYFRKKIEQEGLSDLHASAGAVLLPLLEEEGLTLTGLSVITSMKPPTLTVIMNRLETAGYIRRVRGLSDRRQVHLFLTDTGRMKAEALNSIQKSAGRLLSHGLESESIILANETLNKIISNVNNNVV